MIENNYVWEATYLLFRFSKHERKKKNTHEYVEIFVLGGDMMFGYTRPFMFQQRIKITIYTHTQNYSYFSTEIWKFWFKTERTKGNKSLKWSNDKLYIFDRLKFDNV